MRGGGPLLARRLRPRPHPVRVADDLLQPHDLVPFVAGVDGPVVEVPARQVHLPVWRVRQLRALLLRSDAG